MNIQQAIQAVVDRVDLSQDDAADAMRSIMSGNATPTLFGQF